MSALAGFWQFLNTDIREIPWGEVAENGIEAIATTNDLAEVVKEQAPNLKHLEKIEPFLETLDNPVTQVAISGLPFVSVGIGLLRIYLDWSKINVIIVIEYSQEYCSISEKYKILTNIQKT